MQIDPFIPFIAEQDLTDLSTDELIMVAERLRNSHPFWGSSWYCVDCPGPKHKENFCKNNKEDVAEVFCLEANNQLDRVLEIIVARQISKEELDAL